MENKNFKLNCSAKTYSQDGFMGFYRGVSAPVVGAAFEAAAVFSVPVLEIIFYTFLCCI